MTQSSQHKRIILCSMPWAIYNRPSIQLGSLKAYVEQNSDVQVTTVHPYLYIANVLGIEHYSTIADNGWAGEALFAALMFPERYEKAHRVFKESLGGKQKQLPEFDHLLEKISDTCEQWLTQIDLSPYLFAGFSICFNQLFASLYITDRLKKINSALPIVCGGSSCGGALGQSLLQHFPQIDYVIDGEGEIPLVRLCSWLTGNLAEFPARIYTRTSQDNTCASPTIKDLSELPTPDYDPFYQQLQAVFPDSPFIPTIPLEFSRGCWWNKCTFCNLNLQWCGYRHKKSTQVVKEIEKLTAKYDCLDFTFTDNALPPAEADRFFQTMADLPIDYHFFAEIRGITSQDKLLIYREGGLNTIQVGIESLSTSLLKKMNKGISVIENIAIMKFAAAANISLEGNLIVEFPGSTQSEMEETLENLEYVLPFNPLASATFFLGHGSEVEQNSASYPICAKTHHRKNRALFPPELLASLTLLIKDYRGDRQHQRKLWRPVKEKISLWHAFHESRNDSPALSYRDGSTFLLIRQELPDAKILRHKLQGLSRRIYLYCEEIRTIEEICTHFDSLKESAILAFIHQLCQKRLMYRENDQVLSLAIQCL